MQMAWDTWINQGIFTWWTGRGLFLLLSLLHQQVSTVLYHLNHMIQGDQDGCATSFYCLSVCGPAKLQDVFTIWGIEHLTRYLPFCYFTCAVERKRKKEYSSSSTILHWVQPFKGKSSLKGFQKGQHLEHVMCSMYSVCQV